MFNCQFSFTKVKTLSQLFHARYISWPFRFFPPSRTMHSYKLFPVDSAPLFIVLKYILDWNPDWKMGLMLQLLVVFLEKKLCLSCNVAIRHSAAILHSIANTHGGSFFANSYICRSCYAINKILSMGMFLSKINFWRHAQKWRSSFFAKWKHHKW